MKKGVICSLILICIASSAFAVDVLWSSVTNYTSTKANLTIPVSTTEPMKIITSDSTVKAYVQNTSGDGVAIPANTFVEIKVPDNVTQIVFTHNSSTGTTISRIK